jgi:hypothetical protein
MKKNVLTRIGFLAGICVVVLGMGACEGFLEAEAPVKEEAAPRFWVAEDGTRMADFTVPTRTVSRSISADVARAGINFYEAVFYDGTSYYTFTTAKGNPLKISIPFGTYTSATAILLAGDSDTQTLLATAPLATIPAGGTINASTTAINFTLTALTSDLTDASSVFKDSVTASMPGNTMATKSINGLVVPYHSLAVGDAGCEGKITIANYPAVGLGLGTPTLGSAGVRSEPAAGIGNAGVLIIPGATPVVVAAGTGVVTLTFETPADEGWTKIYYTIPLRGLSYAGNTNGLIWNIKNGISNSVYDVGAHNTAYGGAMLICVGSGAVTWTVNPGGP